MTKEKPWLFPLIVKPCSDKAAFEARPKRTVTVDMVEAKRAFQMSTGLNIVIETPHIIIVKSKDAEITLSRDGRMLIKKVSNQDEVTQVAYRILRTIKAAVKPA